ncbi:hypothetical protein [Paraburkholderia tropica]|uniref:hypothetical protein n=1 Tax=Paraburkholderia tropica TaxID=92647 RepID=UPI002AB7D919|nr:hypothetical protein [Paraburkholderia tropica]
MALDTNLIAAVASALNTPVAGAIAGSVLTLAGSLLSNRSNAKQQIRQIAHSADQNGLQRSHDARESALERKMQLRREVYLPAIEAMFSGFVAVGMLVDPTVQRQDLMKRYAEAISAMGKASAIARAETISAVGAVINLLNEVNADLSQIRVSVEVAYQQLVSFGDVVHNVVADHKRWVDTQTNATVQGAMPADQWRRLNAQIEFLDGQIAKWSGSREASNLALAETQLQFLRRLVHWQEPTSSLLIAAGIALRKELDLTEDESRDIEAAMERNVAAAKIALLNNVKTAEAAVQSLRASTIVNAAES